TAAGADDEEFAAEIDEPSGDIDPNKFQHDQGVVQGVTGQALQIMATLGLCVAGLVRRINNSPQLEDSFHELIDRDPVLQSSMYALSYNHFKGPIQYLTGNAQYKVSWWALDTEQWSIMEQLGLVLE
ncbi:hypothetical protein FRC11_000927, partial [Ceratobasidium sp. 423]